jgi:hypothetical protein
VPGLERLAKLKDYRNTSVIVSNHPYAAVAVMGQRNGRAQLAGPYFRLRTQASSSSDAHAPNVEGRSTDVQIDLKRDWADFMKEYARSTKVEFDASASFADMTVQYLNTVRRLPAPRTRMVHESREFEIPPAHGADYAALKELIQTGANLRPYLARNLQDESKVPRPDKLLGAWGIHHLHLQPGGSDLVLLCKITDDAVFMIHAANHFGTAGLELWVNPELLRIVHENWPEELAECRFNLTSATPPVEDRIVVRRNNANFTVTMPDDTAYFSLLTAKGYCMDDRDRCRDISRELAVFEQFIRDNAREFRAGLNWPDASPLKIRMGFNGRDCFFYEPTNGTEIHPSKSPI